MLSCYGCIETVVKHIAMRRSLEKELTTSGTKFLEPNGVPTPALQWLHRYRVHTELSSKADGATVSPVV